MPRPRFRRSYMRTWLLSVTGGAVVVIVLAVGIGADRDVLSIDGVQFSAQELAVAEERAQRAGSDSSRGPGAVDVLRDDLALFAVARQVGASDVRRPADILDLVDEVNADRAAIDATGGVLYGPVQYDARSFYGKSLTDVREAARTQLEAGAGKAVVTDRDVRERFDEDAAHWAESATTYLLSRAIVPGTGDDRVDELRARELATSGWQTVVGTAAVEALEVTADQLAAGSVSPDVVAGITSSTDGDLVGPERSQAGWVIYRVDSRVVDREQAFAHFESRIRSALYEERLDQMIAAARAAQSVSVP